LGWAHRQNGNAVEAEKYLRKAIELNPKLAEAHSNLSVVLADAGKGEEAKTEAAQAVAIAPENAIFRVVLGNALAKVGDRKAAIEQYQAAIKQKPDYENALYNLGRVLKEDGQISEAKLALSDALKYDPKDDRVLMLLDDMTGDTNAVTPPAVPSKKAK
jgi:protein O-GlcNAc transferase